MARKWNDDQLGRALRYDSLDAAEKITGANYKDDQDTALLGLSLRMRAGEAKQQMLSDAGDSHWGTTIGQYHDIISGIGFQHQFSIPFQGNERKELFSVWWEPRRGILLKFDTYGGSKVNGGQFHYCWKHPDDLDWPTRCSCTSSGHYTKDKVWVGYHDCREAIAYHIRLLDQHGEFIVPWVEPQSIRFTHYMDHPKGQFDWKSTIGLMDRIDAERIELLTQEVRQAIAANPPDVPKCED